MMSPKSMIALLAIFIFQSRAFSQCTTLGQTPSTAFPVCGTSTFHQSTVPLCTTNDIFVPGCSGTGTALYQNKNPFFYKFTCFSAGTLGFTITTNSPNEDYDWQLYDITGHNPEDIFTDNTLVVTGNWAGTYGNTGASAGGVNFLQCASDPAQHLNAFAQMPTLIVGHQYL
ncbi:MAG: PKD domain-containing protein, partial [Chitinophagaceae bacterium]